MPKVLRKVEDAELINLERLAHLLQGLSLRELETLEVLIDKDSLSTIVRSLKELDRGEGISIDEW